MQWSSGLDGDRRLAADLPESRTVQNSDHPGAAGPLRGEKLGPGQGGASWDQTETSKINLYVRGIVFGVISKLVKETLNQEAVKLYNKGTKHMLFDLLGPAETSYNHNTTFKLISWTC